MMIPYDALPEKNEDLAKLEVSFPFLEDNSPDCCPVSMEDVLDYLAIESPDGESLTAAALKFLRTAQVAEKQYWIWSFVESDGEKCYVTVSADPERGETCVGYGEDDYGLTPEQYMLGDYYEVF